MELVEDSPVRSTRYSKPNGRSGAAGGRLDDIAKLNIFMTDLSNSRRSTRSWLNTSPSLPARAAIEISALPKGAQIEMDGILAP